MAEAEAVRKRDNWAKDLFAAPTDGNEESPSNTASKEEDDE
jgi:hypothetical protein